MIELTNIKKHYELNGKEVLILKGISVFIARGEFVSIMGPSGSGKSTLSAILGCLSTPSDGQYKLNGEDVSRMSPNQLARLRNSSIGFIFQDFNLLSGLTAWENVALPLVYGGYGSRVRRTRAMECLAAVGLEQKAYNKPFQLSGGQKQRVAIARALVNHPKFLFADEPTGALDKKTGHEILGIMQRLNLEGHTVIQVTHSPADAQYSKRILHLVDGHVVREESVDKPTIGVTTDGDGAARDQMLSRVWRVAGMASMDASRDLESIKLLIKESSGREAQVGAARAVVRWAGTEIAESLDALAHSNDWVVRAELVKNLSLAPRPVALKYLVQALDDANSWVRHMAMNEFKEIPQNELDHDLQIRLRRCLKDPDERVRANAVYMIGQWTADDKPQMLMDAVKDSDNRVRANAVEAIGRMDVFADFIPLIRDIAHHDVSNRAKANAALILAKVDQKAATTIALEMIATTDILMRSSGAWLLGQLKTTEGNDHLIRLLASEKEEVVLNQITRALAKISRDRFPLSEQIKGVLSQSDSGGA